MFTSARISSVRADRDLGTNIYTIELTRSGVPHRVSRRYSDFQRLHRLLSKKRGRFQGVDSLPELPARDKWKYVRGLAVKKLRLLGVDRLPRLEEYVQALVRLHPGCEDIAVARFFELPGYRMLGLPPGADFYTRCIAHPVDCVLSPVAEWIADAYVAAYVVPALDAVIRDVLAEFELRLTALMEELQDQQNLPPPHLHRSQSLPSLNDACDFQRLVHAGNEHMNNHCQICLGEISRGDLLGLLPCTHFFHEDCLRSWTQKQPSCPTCRDVRRPFVHRRAAGRDPAPVLRRSASN